MANEDEWKKDYYESKSHKKAFIILIIMIIALSIGYLFLKGEEGKPVDIGINITADDVTYSEEGMQSAEMIEACKVIDSVSERIKFDYGYN